MSDGKTQELVAALAGNRIDRRKFLRSAVATGLSSAAAYELLIHAQSVQAQTHSGSYTITTFATGEEDTATSLAIGEEDTITTFACGEEGPNDCGQLYPPTEPPVATTLAIGEEDVTTAACGEEGTLCPVSPPPPPPPPPVPQPTTRRWGEESGHGYIHRRRPGVRRRRQRRWYGWSEW